MTEKFRKYKFKYIKNRLQKRKIATYQTLQTKSTTYKIGYDDLRKIFSKSRTIFNLFIKMSIPAVIVLKEKIVYVNKSLCELFKYSMEELIGKSIYDFVLPEYRNRVRNNYLKRISGKAIYTRYYAKGKRKDGEIISGLVYGTTFVVNNRKYIFSIILDTTELDKYKKEIFLFKKIVEELPISVVITDESPRIEYVNRHFEYLTGYTFSEAFGKNPNILKSGLTPQSTYESLWQTILDDKKWTGEFINKKKNGEFYREKAIIYPVKDIESGEKKYVGIKSDITEEEISQYLKTDSILFEKLNLFSTDISHFLRDFIQKINFLIESKDNKKLFEEYIKNLTAEMEKFIERLDIFSHFTKGTSVDFKSALEENLKRFKSYIKFRGKINIPEGYKIDEKLFSQLFNNLFSILSGKINGKIFLHVKDTGKNFKEPMLEWHEYRELRGKNYILLKFTTSDYIPLNEKDFKILSEPFIYVGRGKINFETTILFTIMKKLGGKLYVKRDPLTFFFFFPYLPEKKEEKMEKREKILIISKNLREKVSIISDTLSLYDKTIYRYNPEKVDLDKVKDYQRAIIFGDIEEKYIKKIVEKVKSKNVIIISNKKKLREIFPEVKFFRENFKLHRFIKYIEEWLR